MMRNEGNMGDFRMRFDGCVGIMMEMGLGMIEEMLGWLVDLMG